MLQKKGVSGKNKGNLQREIPCSVTTVRPLEIVSGQVEELLRMDKLVASNRRYTNSFTLNEAFKDSMWKKIAVDAGGGMTKAIVSTVNVEKLQS